MVVESRLEPKEIDGNQLPMGAKAVLSVKSHSSEPSYVVLEFTGKKITISGKDLIKAVQNILR